MGYGEYFVYTRLVLLWKQILSGESFGNLPVLESQSFCLDSCIWESQLCKLNHITCLTDVISFTAESILTQIVPALLSISTDNVNF